MFPYTFIFTLWVANGKTKVLDCWTKW